MRVYRVYLVGLGIPLLYENPFLGYFSPPNLQVKLLRFLQDQTIDRVGGWVPIHFDARILSATESGPPKCRGQGTLSGELWREKKYKFCLFFTNYSLLAFCQKNTLYSFNQLPVIFFGILLAFHNYESCLKKGKPFERMGRKAAGLSFTTGKIG